MVFFDTYKKDGHVGIYVGDGKFIGSQSSTGVAVVDMTKGYWKDHYKGHARRVTSSEKSNVPTGKWSSIYSNDRSSSYKGGSSYTNTWKTQKEALKSPGYKSYKSHLAQAMQMGGVPSGWAVALTELVGRESTWSSGVKNSKSTAHGYAQFLNSTRKTYEKKTGLNYSNPVHQIVMMAQYVKDRYGTPEKALKFWDKNNWY